MLYKASKQQATFPSLCEYPGCVPWIQHSGSEDLQVGMPVVDHYLLHYTMYIDILV